MKLIIIILVLLYALLPTDLLPDALLGLGQLDDLLVAYLAWRFFFASRPDRSGSAPGDRGSHAERERPAHNANGPQSPHDILGVPKNASRDEIKAAYRKRVNQYHPDKVAHLGEEFQHLAEKRFKEIQQAFDALMQSHNHDKSS